MKQISVIKDRIGIEYTNKIKEDKEFRYPLITDIDKVMYEWSKMDNYKEHSIALEHFLIPVQAICRGTNDHNSLTILSHVTDCIYALENIDAVKEFVKKGIENMIDSLRKKESSLKQIISDFDKIEKKN